MRKLFWILPLILGLIVIPVTISAQSTEIPAWVKGVANFWAEGNITDNEFGEAITFLIEQEIIKVEIPTKESPELQNRITQLESENNKLENEISNLKNENSKLKQQINSFQKTESETPPKTSSDEGFSGLVCKKDYIGFVQLTGKYTNGDKPYSFISITLAIIGENGEVLDTGIGIISNIDAYQTKVFTASSGYSGNFKSCEVQVDLAY